ncbi:MAG: hypothetical protein WAU53_22440, partial [Rhodoplanes sp.]
LALRIESVASIAMDIQHDVGMQFHWASPRLSFLADCTPNIFRGLREIEWVNFGGGSAKNLCIG